MYVCMYVYISPLSLSLSLDPFLLFSLNKKTKTFVTKSRTFLSTLELNLRTSLDPSYKCAQFLEPKGHLDLGRTTMNKSITKPLKSSMLATIALSKCPNKSTRDCSRSGDTLLS